MAPSVKQESGDKRGARAYVLLRCADGCAEDVARAMGKQRGVLRVDRLEGMSDVMALMKAANRTALASTLNNALRPLEDMVVNVEPFLVRESRQVDG